MTAQPTLTYIVTVYKKEPYLANTCRSLLQQEGGIDREYIFVDDVSPDRSLEVVEATMQGVPNVKILRNARNCGPSVRSNQAIAVATGKYVQFMDSDDILAKNASAVMLGLLQKHHAQVIYGTWEKTGQPGELLLSRRISDTPTPYISDEPLHYVLTHRVLRMTQMVERETLLRSGGFDERVFIQDESLPLYLSLAAKRWLQIHEPVVLVPKIEGELSGNRSQLNHDRFFAQYHFLQKNPNLPMWAVAILRQKLLSAAWKEVRDQSGHWRAVGKARFWQYLAGNSGLFSPSDAQLAEFAAAFAAMPNIRRVPAECSSSEAPI